MSRLTPAQKCQPFRGYLSGSIYYAKRVGWRWQVWFAYRDGSADPDSGAAEWQACSVRYWRRTSAERAANSMWHAFNAGVWCESGRAALTEKDQPR